MNLELSVIVLRGGMKKLESEIDSTCPSLDFYTYANGVMRSMSEE